MTEGSEPFPLYLWMYLLLENTEIYLIFLESYHEIRLDLKVLRVFYFLRLISRSQSRLLLFALFNFSISI